MEYTSSAVKPDKCPWCGSLEKHVGHCPSVKAFEYHPDGKIKRVEFVEPVFDPFSLQYGWQPVAPK